MMNPESVLRGMASQHVAMWDPVFENPARVRQYWILALSAGFSGDVDSLLASMRKAAVDVLRKAAEESGIAEPDPPGVDVTLLSEESMLVRLEIASRPYDQLNAWFIVPSWVLREADRLCGISTIYGIPKQYWLILSDGRPDGDVTVEWLAKHQSR